MFETYNFLFLFLFPFHMAYRFVFIVLLRQAFKQVDCGREPTGSVVQTQTILFSLLLYIQY